MTRNTSRQSSRPHIPTFPYTFQRSSEHSARIVVPLLTQNQNPPRAHRSFPPPAPPVPSSPRRRRIKPENRTRRKLLNPNPRTYLDIRRRLTTALRVRPARERLRAIAKARARVHPSRQSFAHLSLARATIAVIRVDGWINTSISPASHAPAHRSPRVSQRASPGFEASFPSVGRDALWRSVRARRSAGSSV